MWSSENIYEYVSECCCPAGTPGTPRNHVLYTGSRTIYPPCHENACQRRADSPNRVESFIGTQLQRCSAPIATWSRDRRSNPVVREYPGRRLRTVIQLGFYVLRALTSASA